MGPLMSPVRPGALEQPSRLGCFLLDLPTQTTHTWDEGPVVTFPLQGLLPGKWLHPLPVRLSVCPPLTPDLQPLLPAPGPRPRGENTGHRAPPLGPGPTSREQAPGRTLLGGGGGGNQPVHLGLRHSPEKCPPPAPPSMLFTGGPPSPTPNRALSPGPYPQQSCPPRRDSPLRRRKWVEGEVHSPQAPLRGRTRGARRRGLGQGLRERPPPEP